MTAGQQASSGVPPCGPTRQPRWPGHAEWHAWLKFNLWFLVFFIPAYFGTGFLTEGTTRTLALYLPAEVQIPFVSWMIVPYLSLYTLFLLPLFHMTAPEMRILTRQSILCLLVAGLCFLMFPARLGYRAVEISDWTAPFFDTIRALGARHNLAPSLHVAFTSLIVLGVWHCASRPWQALYMSWFALLAISTLLVHEHHLIDVVTAVALALLARRIFPLRPSPARTPRPAAPASASP